MKLKYDTSISSEIYLFIEEIDTNTHFKIKKSADNLNWTELNNPEYNDSGYYKITDNSNSIVYIEILGNFGHYGFKNGGYDSLSNDEINFKININLLEVLNFGEHNLISFEGAFSNAINLIKVPNTLPSFIVDLSFMFNRAISFNQNLNQWDVSRVINFNEMFGSAKKFNNGDLGNNGNIPLWNVDDITVGKNIGNNMISMRYMFRGAESFNQNLNQWDVSRVTNFSNMFANASLFNNGDDGNNGNNPLWDNDDKTLGKNCNDIMTGGMFKNAISFNQNLNTWYVNKIKYLNYIFRSFDYNGDGLGDIEIIGIFSDAKKFNNGDKGNNGDNPLWNDPTKTIGINWSTPTNNDFINNSLSEMFSGAESFNQNIDEWDVSKTLDFSDMFAGASKFNNGDIGDYKSKPLWKYESKTVGMNTGEYNLKLSSMFETSTDINFNQSLNAWNVSRCIDFSRMFLSFSTIEINKFNNGGESMWNIPTKTVGANIKDKYITLEKMFFNCEIFNQNLNTWDVSRVDNFERMFRDTVKFNNSDSGLELWGDELKTVGANIPDGKKINLAGMFECTHSFNQNLNKWDVSKAHDFRNMFNDAIKFNNGDNDNNGQYPLWNNPQKTLGENSFNDIKIGSIFNGAEAFNQNINKWNVSRIYDFITNLDDEEAGGGDITDRIKFTSDIFFGAKLFNNGDVGDLKKSPLWNDPLKTIGANISNNYLNLSGFFYGAESFNQDISTWDVSRVNDFSNMFHDAKLFNNGDKPLWNNLNKTVGKNILKLQGDTINVNLNKSNYEFNIYDKNIEINNAELDIGLNKIKNGIINLKNNNVALNTDDTLNYVDFYDGTIIMNSMFENAISFNQNIDSWDISKVIDFSNMFKNAIKFNNGDIANNNQRPLWNNKLLGTNVENYNKISFQINDIANSIDFNRFPVKLNNCKLNNISIDISNGYIKYLSGTQDFDSFYNIITVENSDIEIKGKVLIGFGEEDFNEEDFNEEDFNDEINQIISKENDQYVLTINKAILKNFTGTIIKNNNIYDFGSDSDNEIIFDLNEGIINFPNSQNITDPNLIKKLFDMENLLVNLENTKVNYKFTNGTVDLNNMFNGATSFNQNINQWNISKVISMEKMFNSVKLSFDVYNNILLSFAEQPSLNNIKFDGGLSQYRKIAINSRNILTNQKNWIVVDGGLFIMPPSDIILSNNTILENNFIDDIIGSLVTVDEDADAESTYTYTVSDLNNFSIKNNNLVANNRFNYENINSYNINISVTTQNGTINKNFLIQILDVIPNPEIPDMFPIRINGTVNGIIKLRYCQPFILFANRVLSEYTYKWYLNGVLLNNRNIHYHRVEKEGNYKLEVYDNLNKLIGTSNCKIIFHLKN